MYTGYFKSAFSLDEMGESIAKHLKQGKKSNKACYRMRNPSLLGAATVNASLVPE